MHPIVRAAIWINFIGVSSLTLRETNKKISLWTFLKTFFDGFDVEKMSCRENSRSNLTLGRIKNHMREVILNKGFSLTVAVLTRFAFNIWSSGFLKKWQASVTVTVNASRSAFLFQYLTSDLNFVSDHQSCHLDHGVLLLSICLDTWKTHLRGDTILKMVTRL